jgi:YidC/Oxa1 family membrane protein insertase
MGLWHSYVHLIAQGLALLAQAMGGNFGLAIVVGSLGVRLMLLPITLRLALRAKHRQAQTERIQSEIARIRAESGKSPKAEARIQELLRENAWTAMDPKDLTGGLVQAPVIGGLYGAISAGFGAGRGFAWIANLAQPDAILGLLAGGTAFLSALSAGGKEPSRWLTAAIMGLVVAFFVRRIAAALGLYWAVSGVVSLGQTLWLRRAARPAT